MEHVLQKVLDSAGIDPERCALLLSLSPQVFSQWLSGQSEIPESVLPILSSVLSVPPSTLVAPYRNARQLRDSDITPQLWFKFRGPRLTEIDREYVIIVRQIGHYLNELEEVTRQKSVQWKSLFETIRSSVDVQAPPREQGKLAAGIFRQSTAIGHGTTGSGEVLRGLLRALGVLVFETPLAKSQIEGCSFYVGSMNAPRPCAFVNTHQTTWFRRNALLVHEVGHAIFEPFTGASIDFAGAHETDDEGAEKRADAFAQEVLIPREVLFHAAQSYGVKWNEIGAITLAQLVALTHVEQKMVAKAACDAGFVSAEQAEELKQMDIASELRSVSDHALSTEEFLEKTGRQSEDWIGKRATTVLPIDVRLPIGYVNAVIEAYRNRQISSAKAAEYLLIDEEEVFERFGDLYAGKLDD